MARSGKFDYFAAFEKIATYADEEADMLLRILRNFDIKRIHVQMDDMHEIENASDIVNHDVFHTIVNDFITPLDREDIIELTQELDDVVDGVEEIMQMIYMLNITEMEPDALEMIEILTKSTEDMRLALAEFPNYKKSTMLMKHIVDVNTHEEEADRLYINAMHYLYSTCDDPVKLLKWTKIYEKLEDCCDRCEHAVDVLTTIIMKTG